jgi:N-acetyltransferase
MAEDFQLEGKHVRIEPPSYSHIDGLVNTAAWDPALYRWSSVPQGKIEAAKYIETALACKHAGTAVPFAIAPIDDGSIIGSTRFWNLERWSWPPGHALHGRCTPDACEIGYTWLTQSAIRTGGQYRIQIVHADACVRNLESSSRLLYTDERNAASRVAIERIGGRFEGILRAHRMASDFISRNSARGSIVVEEWPAVKPPLRQRVTRPE